MIAAIYEHGIKNFRLSDPPPEYSFSRSEEDQLTDHWFVDSIDAFVEGQVHPLHPGMIIDMARVKKETDTAWQVALTSFGDARGTKPTKIIRRGSRRTLNEGWDELPMEYLSWHARLKPCTATAADNVVSCNSHGFANSKKIMFRDLTGGAGITPASDSALGVEYYVINATPHTFKISLTAGGAAVDITSNMTDGKVCGSEFVKGARHPDHAHMWLVDIETSDRYTDWQNVSAMYRGMMEGKLFKRIITTNSQTMSPSDVVTVSFAGGFTDKYGEIALPKVVCTDTYLTTSTIATDQIPYSEAEGGTPPSPPSVRSVVISAAVEKLTYHWPAGWSRMAEEHVDSIPGVAVHLKKRVSEYNWAITMR